MKYLIVGLGNIGAEYRNTRHNIGFKVLDALSEASNAVFEHDRYAYVAEGKYKGKTLVMIKPTTYMNLSGKAVNYWLQQTKTDISKMLIVVDDIAIPFGTIRIKTKGSDAGHNGLAHINQTLGHNKYNRLRFGLGNNFPRGKQIDYVLGEWSKEEELKLPERIDKMVEAIQSFSKIGIERTMNFFNGQ